MYGLMTLVTVTLVIVLTLVMLGYRFNRADGRLEQGGLVQFESKPSGADVIVDDAHLGTRTSSKTTLTAGQHFIKMERSGYKQWQKSIDVTKGKVLWLNYARLIPNELSSSRVADFATISSTAASADNKWLAIKEDPSAPVIRLANIAQDEAVVTQLQLPASSYTHPSEGKGQTFVIETWDPSNRYLLVRHTYDDTKVEWMVVDTQNSENTKNITALLGMTASKVVFSNANSAILYVLDGTAVRRVDLGATTLSGPLLTGIADFGLYDKSTVTYVSLLDPATKKRSVGYLTEGASKSRTLRSYSDDGLVSLHLKIDKYFDDTYAAISYGENVEILKGDLPHSDAVDPSLMRPAGTMTLPGGVQYLSTKSVGRFVVAQAGATYTVYDIELQKMTSTTTKGTTEVTKEFGWLDKYMLWSDRDGMVRFYEFDGANQQDVMPVIPGFSVVLSPTGKYVYGMTKSADGTKFHLERTRLIL